MLNHVNYEKKTNDFAQQSIGCILERSPINEISEDK